MNGLEVVLTVLTLNVLQLGHDAKTRYPAIDAGLQKIGADVVTLQEVRRLRGGKTSADRISGYPHRVVDGRYAGYYLAILSKHPIKRSLRIRYRNNRARMALGAVISVRGQELLVVTTHLNYQLKHHSQRRKQLEALFAGAAAFQGPVIVTGDMNFGDGASEERAIPNTYRDAWRTLHPDKPGLTWDNEKNPMARRGRLRGEPSRRLDRIFTTLKPVSAKLVFDQPIAKDLFPSDHFGVVAELAR